MAPYYTQFLNFIFFLIFCSRTGLSSPQHLWENSLFNPLFKAFHKAVSQLKGEKQSTERSSTACAQVAKLNASVWVSQVGMGAWKCNSSDINKDHEFLLISQTSRLSSVSGLRLSNAFILLPFLSCVRFSFFGDNSIGFFSLFFSRTVTWPVLRLLIISSRAVR